jgi:hypothetical protein
MHAMLAGCKRYTHIAALRCDAAQRRLQIEALAKVVDSE